MNYTEQRYNKLWELDDNSDNYCQVLSAINTEFRTFGDGLISIMENHFGQKIDDPIEILKASCLENDVDIQKIGNGGTLRNWFSGRPRPKKGEDSREKMFALAFALGLTISETKDLFHKVYLDRAFNQRNYRELIYYYCLDKGLSYKKAEELITKVNIDDVSSNDATMRTVFIASDISNIDQESELINYIRVHGHNFSINNASARTILINLKQQALRAAQREALEAWDDTVFYGKDRNSDSFLYYVMTNLSVTGSKGTKTVTFKNAQFPKEIKNNFPQVKSLSDTLDSYEEIRKVIILLFSYWFWTEANRADIDDVYDDYVAQLNPLLLEAGMAPLYCGNPFDWLFLYCSAQDVPLDSFQGALAEALGYEE